MFQPDRVIIRSNAAVSSQKIYFYNVMVMLDRILCYINHLGSTIECLAESLPTHAGIILYAATASAFLHFVIR
jgi:hypothetical protein